MKEKRSKGIADAGSEFTVAFGYTETGSIERRRQSNAQVTESLRQKKISHHHHITHSRNHPLKVALWLSLRAGDPRYLVRRTEFVLKWFKHNVLYCAEFST